MRNKEIERILSTYKVYIDTCSLMEESNGFFEFELTPLLLKNNRKIYTVENVKNELKKLLNIPSKSFQAKYGLDNLKVLEDNNLLVFENSHKSAHADLAFLPVLIEARRREDVCLITEDKRLALDVLTNIKHLESVTFQHDITALKVHGGNPALWDIFEIEKKIDLVDIHKREIIDEVHTNKLLISLVVDNSLTMKGDRIDDLRNALKLFIDEMGNGDLRRTVEYEIVAFEDFNSKVLKSFKEEEFNINLLQAGKMPFLDKAISQSVLDITNREAELSKQGYKLYKPWLVVLSDGQSFDDTENSAHKIEQKKNDNGLLFLPFCLSQNEINPKIEPLIAQKAFIKIGQNKLNLFAQWLIDFVVQRLTTPLDKPVSLDKKSFEGWAIIK